MSGDGSQGDNEQGFVASPLQDDTNQTDKDFVAPVLSAGARDLD